MKQFYTLLFALFLCSLSQAQVEGASKLYAYRQASMPGTVKLDRNGNPKTVAPQYNYFIYLSSSSVVTPLEIWINGEAYTVNSTRVSSPVEYKNPSSENKSKLLVPKTAGKVLQLTSSGKKVEKPTQKGKTLSTKNELVVIYKGSGKLYYKAVAKLTELETVYMQ